MRTTATGLLVVLLAAGCASATTGAGPAGSATTGTTAAGLPARAMVTVTVPPLSSSVADPPETTAPSPPAPADVASAPASTTPPATTVPSDTVPAAPAPTPSDAGPVLSAPAPVTTTTPDPAPAPALPAAVAPYNHVLGFHGSAKVAYLTFDDGPGPDTPAILDALDAAGVKATFCQVGSRIADYAEAERRVIADGHTLCNHSWDHNEQLGAAAASDIASEISQTEAAMAAFGGSSHYFRAPGGNFGDAAGVLRQVCQSAAVVPLGWGVDSQDWRKPGVDAIVNNVLSAISPGAVVLLHDAGGDDRAQTIAALPLIIQGLRAAGYDLQPLPPDGI